MKAFNYILPDKKKFYESVINDLKATHPAIASRLKDGYCVISANSSCSKKRWDAYDVSVYFYVPGENFIEPDSEETQAVLKSCDRIMPKEAGFDVGNVEFSLINELELKA